MSLKNRYAIIMAGGSGERFWPVSRKRKPKHLLKLYNSKTLIQNTYNLIRGAVKKEHIFVVTSEEHYADIRRQLKGLSPGQIIAEPLPRNTAAAIALGLAAIRRRSQAAVIAVLPSDHLIDNAKAFSQDLRCAFEEAETHQAFVSIGIRPTFASTGYGYIKLSRKISGNFFRVKSFIEKPSTKKAQRYLRAKSYLWNSGIVVFPEQTATQAFLRYLPTLGRAMTRMEKSLSKKSARMLKAVYSRLQNISIDYGILEKVKDMYCLKARFQWSDIGSWDAFCQLHPKDSRGNARNVNFVQVETDNTFAYDSKGKLIAAVGIKDQIIISTDDAVLVCHKDQAQEVKKIISQIRRKKHLRKFL